MGARESWRAGATFFEEGVHAVNDGGIFGGGEFAVWVATFERGGFGFGAEVAVLLHTEVFFGEARERIYQAGVRGGVGSEFLFEVAGLKIVQGVINLDKSDLDSGVIEAGGVAFAGEFDGAFLPGDIVSQPVLFAEPEAETFSLVTGEIADGEVRGLWLEFLHNGGIGCAIEQHLVDAVTHGFGQPGDFAPGAVWGFFRQRSWGGWRCGGEG